jgi:hypothetical protein
MPDDGGKTERKTVEKGDRSRVIAIGNEKIGALRERSLALSTHEARTCRTPVPVH